MHTRQVGCLNWSVHSGGDRAGYPAGLVTLVSGKLTFEDSVYLGRFVLISGPGCFDN